VGGTGVPPVASGVAPDARTAPRVDLLEIERFSKQSFQAHSGATPE